MDPDTARSTLGIPRGTTLTTSYVEAAFAHAVQVIARPASPGVLITGAVYDESVLRTLEEAQAVLLHRSRHLPPRGEAIGLLTVMQFFLGGFVLFGTAKVRGD